MTRKSGKIKQPCWFLARNIIINIYSLVHKLFAHDMTCFARCEEWKRIVYNLMLYEGGCGSPVRWMRLVRSMLRGESIFCGRRNTSSNYTEFSLLFCGIANSSSPWCSFYHCLEIFRSNLYPFSMVFGCVKTSRFVTIAS